MAISYPLLHTHYFFAPGGTGTYNTAADSQDVGSGDRIANAIVFWTTNNRGVPSGFAVGANTLTLVGSVFSPSGFPGKFAHYRGALSVSGAQDLVASFTATPDFDGGLAGFVILVTAGGGALTQSDTLALGEQVFGGGGGTLARAIGSDTGKTSILLALDKAGSGAAVSAQSGSTLISGSTVNEGAAVTKPGASPNVTPGITYGPFAETASIGFTISEAAGGTPVGLASETDTALALAAKQIKATGLATETDTAFALTTAAGFDFHSAAGLIFGDLAGALTSLAREATVSMVLRVYAVASPGALVVESGTLTTDSNGRLARYTHASLVAGTSYICTFIRASDGEVVSTKLTAT